MNRETRTFIWGLLLMLLCGSGLSIYLIRYQKDMPIEWYDLLSMAACLYGTIAGAVRVFKVVD
jgi:hypothetical protein